MKIIELIGASLCISVAIIAGIFSAALPTCKIWWRLLLMVLVVAAGYYPLFAVIILGHGQATVLVIEAFSFGTGFFIGTFQDRAELLKQIDEGETDEQANR